MNKIEELIHAWEQKRDGLLSELDSHASDDTIDQETRQLVIEINSAKIEEIELMITDIKLLNHVFQK